jgi:hypothetical protein
MYYTYSPPLAEYIAAHDGLRQIVRIALYPLIGIAYVGMRQPAVIPALLVVLAIMGYGVLQRRKRDLIPLDESSA